MSSSKENTWSVIISFGLISAAAYILLKTGRFIYLNDLLSIELVIAGLSLLFLIGGIYIARKFFIPVNTGAQKADKPLSADITPVADTDRVTELGLSEREMEVLQWIASGLSNQEIGEKLYLSESTIKKHVSAILEKLDVKRRTQAVKAARELGILA